MVRFRALIVFIQYRKRLGNQERNHEVVRFSSPLGSHHVDSAHYLEYACLQHVKTMLEAHHENDDRFLPLLSIIDFFGVGIGKVRLLSRRLSEGKVLSSTEQIWGFALNS